jgi:nitroreductase
MMHGKDMTPIRSLLTRTSLAGAFLSEPAPTDTQLHEILGAAQRASDHGRLRPWRFFVVRPAQYGVLYDRLAEAAGRVKNDPDSVPQQREKYRKQEKAPVLIVAAASITRGHKVAEIEQLFAAAGATQLVLNAAHALDFGAFMFSGAGVFDPALKADFGLAPADHIIGFICLGTPASERRPGTPPEDSVRAGLEITAREWAAPGTFEPLRL